MDANKIPVVAWLVEIADKCYGLKKLIVKVETPEEARRAAADYMGCIAHHGFEILSVKPEK